MQLFSLVVAVLLMMMLGMAAGLNICSLCLGNLENAKNYLIGPPEALIGNLEKAQLILRRTCDALAMADAGEPKRKNDCLTATQEYIQQPSNDDNLILCKERLGVCEIIDGQPASIPIIMDNDQWNKVYQEACSQCQAYAGMIQKLVGKEKDEALQYIYMESACDVYRLVGSSKNFKKCTKAAEVILEQINFKEATFCSTVVLTGCTKETTKATELRLVHKKNKNEANNLIVHKEENEENHSVHKDKVEEDIQVQKDEEESFQNDYSADEEARKEKVKENIPAENDADEESSEKNYSDN